MRLDNGLQVLLACNHAAPVVAVQAWVGVGSADEPRRHAGIAHVFEHMLFKGTERYGVGEIAATVESAGGEINAWTSFDQTVYHVVLASRHFDTAVDVLAEALRKPAFEAEELEREREVILEEIRQTNDDPMRTVSSALFSTAYTAHPYRFPVIGTPESVQTMKRRDLVSFLESWYVANNITLVISGDVDAAVAMRTVKRAFGDMPSRPIRRRRRREPEQTRARVTVCTRDVTDGQIAIGFHVPTIVDEDAAALDLGAIVLGQGESSRMATRLMRERELVTSAYAYAHTLRDRGLFVLSAGARPDDVSDAVEALAAEVARLVAEPPATRELDKARHAIRADAIYQRETAEGMARKLGYYETMAGDVDFESEILRRVYRLGPREVSSAVERHLRPDNATVAVLLPHKGKLRNQRSRDACARELGRALARGFASGAARRKAERRRLPERDDLVREVLPNGIRVVVKRDASVPVVAVRTVWTGGARRETAKVSGITSLMSSTITRGCGALSPAQLIDVIDELAGALVGISGRNSFGVRSEWLSADWERGFDLMADCLTEPRFEESELAREKRRVLDDLASRRDSASFVAFRNLAESLFRKHPYRLPVSGTPESVANLTRKQVMDFYRTRYPVAELTLTAVGDVDPDRLLAKAAERFGDAGGARRRQRAVPQESFTGRSAASREIVEYMAREQAHLCLGFPGMTIRDPDRPALEVLMTLLGGQGGRLFLELRDRRALAYRVSGFSVEGIDPGYVAVYVACSPAKIDQAREAVWTELDRVCERAVTTRELERATRYLVGAHEISLQRRASLAAALALNEAYGVGHDYHLRYAREIERVTAADVTRVARETFDRDLAVTSIVTAPGGVA